MHQIILSTALLCAVVELLAWLNLQPKLRSRIKREIIFGEFLIQSENEVLERLDCQERLEKELFEIKARDSEEILDLIVDKTIEIQELRKQVQDFDARNQ